MARLISYDPASALLYGEDCAPIAPQRVAEMERRGWRHIGHDRNGFPLMAGPVAALTASADEDDDRSFTADDPGLADFERLMSEAIARAAHHEVRQYRIQRGRLAINRLRRNQPTNRRQRTGILPTGDDISARLKRGRNYPDQTQASTPVG